MEWREAATERLKEIGEKVTSDVEAVLDDPTVEAQAPEVISVADADLPLDPAL